MSNSTTSEDYLMTDPFDDHGVWLFVDDERPTPEGWLRALNSQYVIYQLEGFKDSLHTIERLSLDHDLEGDDTTMPILHWMRDNQFWPDELYLHTANQDAEDDMLAFIHAHAPADTLRGWGCNYWGTGPDSIERNEVFERATSSPARLIDAPTGTPLETAGDTIRITASGN